MHRKWWFRSFPQVPWPVLQLLDISAYFPEGRLEPFAGQRQDGSCNAAGLASTPAWNVAWRKRPWHLMAICENVLRTGQKSAGRSRGANGSSNGLGDGRNASGTERRGGRVWGKCASSPAPPSPQQERSVSAGVKRWRSSQSALSKGKGLKSWAPEALKFAFCARRHGRDAHLAKRPNSGSSMNLAPSSCKITITATMTPGRHKVPTSLYCRCTANMELNSKDLHATSSNEKRFKHADDQQYRQVNCRRSLHNSARHPPESIRSSHTSG
mmetsp:Transcript_52440/g.147167  ORF Transcript_52440/g.147167 Transcript_52440/m.147167 type:complete len:269 (+) Transcript_52440:755-1561(+)